MTRNGILATVAFAIATLGNSFATFADDEIVVSELYGRAVHAYFDGLFEKSHQDLSDAIELGTSDPRIYYFRGLAKVKLGRMEEAVKDFEKGGQMEASGPAQFYNVGRSLERIQGDTRLQLEKIRRKSRISMRLRQKKIEMARIEEFKRNEKLRQEASSKIVLPKPSEKSAGTDDPFGTTAGGAASPQNPTPTPTAPTKPDPEDPFGSSPPSKPTNKPVVDSADPFGNPVPKKEEATKPTTGTDPFNAPVPKKDEAKPAKGPDPFAEPEPKKNDSSEKTGEDPFGN